MPRSPQIAALVCGALALTVTASRATERVSGQIDRIIQRKLDAVKVPASPRADDAEFLRRLYLDLTGRIPSYEQTTAFLSSSDAERRARLIDELLARPEYGLHFATVWRDLLVDRSAENAQVRQSFSWEFVDWLATGFNQDRGWDDIVAELMTAEGEAKTNPATLLLLANRMNNFPRPADLASTTGKLFMGLQLRCAQCHDHPYVDAWHQDDFWGIAAFFGQLRDHAQQPDGNSPKPAFYDRPNDDAKKETGYLNRLKRAGLLPPEAGPRIAIPQGSDPNQVARVVPAKFFLGAAPALANQSYRARFAKWLTAPENPYFARASVNRLWAGFFGRGLINPVDDVRPDKAPTHPELLDLLEKEFKAGFSHKRLIRAICNSEVYQRTSRPLPENREDQDLYSHMAIRQLSADQMTDALAIAAGRAPALGKNRDQQSAPFATAEPDSDPTELSHGMPQFLLLMNSGTTNTAPPQLGKLTTGKSKDEAITAVYRAVLSRSPRSAELQRSVAYLDQAGNQGYRDIYWALVNSAEFMLNH